MNVLTIKHSLIEMKWSFLKIANLKRPDSHNIIVNAKILLAIVFILMPSTVLSQTVNLDAPQAIYYFMDEAGKNYKLVIKPKIEKLSTSYYNKGKAELTRFGDNPETFYGSWRKETKYNESPAELEFIDINIDYCDMDLGDGRGLCRFTISRDGWVYPDMYKCMEENPKHRVKISKKKL